MADSIREKIMKNLVAAVKAVTVANGFEIDVAPVKRSTEPLVNVTEFPSALLIEEEEDEESIVGQGSFGTIEHRLRVRLLLYIRKFDDNAEESNKVLANVTKKLMEDVNRGGNAIDTNQLGNRKFSVKENEPLGGIEQTIEVWYRTLRNDPFAIG